MMKFKYLLLSGSLCIAIIMQGYGQSNVSALNVLYLKAIDDALTADTSEVCDTLWSLGPENQRLDLRKMGNDLYVRVGCFTRFPDSFKDSVIVNSWGEFWVFIPQQFDTRMKQVLAKDSDTLLRVRQMLGLPPDNKNTHVAQMWINLNDLFRPAGSPSISAATASPYLSKDASEEYRTWFITNIYNTYFSEGTHFPWTRLGYTYDWAPGACEVGLSEFCVRKNSRILTIGVVKATQYFK